MSVLLVRELELCVATHFHNMGFFFSVCATALFLIFLTRAFFWSSTLFSVSFYIDGSIKTFLFIYLQPIDWESPLCPQYYSLSDLWSLRGSIILNYAVFQSFYFCKIFIVRKHGALLQSCCIPHYTFNHT